MGSKRPNESVASDRATKKQQKQQKDQTAASTTEYRLSCPYACNLETGDGASLNHPCGGALTPFKDIAKLNEHLKRSHSLLYTCPDCMSPYQIVSKTSLEVLRRAHQTECKGRCDADQSRSPGRRPGKATGPMRMDPEQHSRWMKWREQEVAHIDGESTIRTNWRKIWKCLWPDAHPPAIIICKHGVVPQPTTGPIPKEEDNITLDPALAQPADSVSPSDLPYAHRQKSDTFHETFWDSTNPSNALVVNSPSAVRIPPGFPYHGGGGGNTMPDATSDVIATSDDGRNYLALPAGQQPFLSAQHNNAFQTYSPYPPSMVYSDETYDFTTTTALEDQQTGYNPQYLYPPSQTSGGAGFSDQHEAGFVDESIESGATLGTDESLKDQNTSLLGIGSSNAVQDDGWMDK